MAQWLRTYLAIAEKPQFSFHYLQGGSQLTPCSLPLHCIHYLCLVSPGTQHTCNAHTDVLANTENNEQIFLNSKMYSIF